MGGLLLLCAFLFCGMVIADCLFRSKSPLVRLWLGLCMGLMLMMWLPVPFAYLLKFGRAANLLGLGVAAGGAAALLCTSRKKPRANAAFCGDLSPWLLLALVVPLTLLSGYLLHTHYLRDVNGALHVGQSTYGDLCLHLGIASSLQNAPFPPDYSILPGTMLGYPFLADSMVTSMLLFGSTLRTGFVVTGTLMMALVYTGFVIFAWELTRKKTAVALAFVLMFLNGGLGFLYTLDGAWKNPNALLEVFTGFYKTPTNQPELNLRWVNVICDMMVPQRTLLCGWMTLLPALYMFVDAVREKKIERFALLGLWAGLMPMVHTHSFFALGLMSAGAMVYQLIHSRNRRSALLCYLAYGMIAVALALPQLLTWTFPQTLTGTSNGLGSLNLRFNWVNNQGDGQLIDGYFWFWIKNVGLVYLLMVPAALSAKKGSLLRAISVGALVIYTAAEIVQFQPNPYDNNKLFYVAYMLMLPAVGLYLLKLWHALKGLNCQVLLACLFIAVSTVSAGLTIAREVVSDYRLFSAEEVEAAEFIKESIPEDATFLTGDQHVNLVAALTGRNIVCGTGSYLYYHGVDYSAQRDAEARMLAEPANNQDLFELYNVDYIYISDWERYDFLADEAWYRGNCDLVYDAGGISIFAAPTA